MNSDAIIYNKYRLQFLINNIFYQFNTKCVLTRFVKNKNYSNYKLQKKIL